MHVIDVPTGSQSLLGRDAQRTALSRALSAARHGAGAVLVLRGDIGVGKTALLNEAVAQADDMWVLRVNGFQAETGCSYAALQQLVGQVGDDLDALSSVRRSAVERAIGTVDGAAGDPSQLAGGVLDLLAQRSARSPVLLIIDDAQWLDRDSMHVLELVAAQLDEDRIALLAATTPQEQAIFASTAQLVVTDLDERAAGRLLATSAVEPIAAEVAAEIVRLVGGNPAGLLDVGQCLSMDQRLGRSALPDPMPPGPSLNKKLTPWFANLTGSAQMVAVIAALESTGSAARVWAGAARLGLDADSPGVGLLSWRIQLAESVRFSPAPFRSVVALGASADQRRDAHRVLALSYEADGEAGLAAWHRAALGLGPDLPLANELEAAADSLDEQLGEAFEPALRRRIAVLSAGSNNHARRLLAAAAAHLTFGYVTDASELLDEARASAAGIDSDRAALALGGMLAFERGDPGAAQKLLTAARSIPSTEARVRDALLRKAVAAALDDREDSLDELLPAIVAEAAAMRQSPADPVRGPTRGAADLAALLRPRRSQPHRSQTEPADANPARGIGDVLTDLALAWTDALEALDDRALRQVSRELGSAAQMHPAPARRVAALARAIISHVLLGELEAAESLMTNARADAEIHPRMSDVLLPAEALILAWRASASDARPSIDKSLTGLGSHSQGRRVALSGLVVLELAGGQFAAAARAAGDVSLNGVLPRPLWNCADLIEAYVRSDQRAQAEKVFGILAHGIDEAPTDWSLGLSYRSEALLGSDPRNINDAFLASIDRLNAAGLRIEQARSRLLYGEWLRRRRQRRDARRHLRSARDDFADAGARAFALRAERELDATGAERVGPRRVERRDDLTPRERQVAQLAAAGASTISIAESLLLTPATVAGHLRSIYRKLGVSRRTELRSALKQHDRV